MNVRTEVFKPLAYIKNNFPKKKYVIKNPNKSVHSITGHEGPEGE